MQAYLMFSQTIFMDTLMNVHERLLFFLLTNIHELFMNVREQIFLIISPVREQIFLIISPAHILFKIVLACLEQSLDSPSFQLIQSRYGPRKIA